VAAFFIGVRLIFPQFHGQFLSGRLPRSRIPVVAFAQGGNNAVAIGFLRFASDLMQDDISKRRYHPDYR
jgi:hypothetical protein